MASVSNSRRFLIRLIQARRARNQRNELLNERHRQKATTFDKMHVSLPVDLDPQGSISTFNEAGG